jgi:chromatin structure-remodeling complex subunit SFH1
MQPILASSSNTGGAANSLARSGGTRRGGVVNYAEPESGDEAPEPDAGERDKDSDDSDFGGGAKSVMRASRIRNGFSRSYSASPAPQFGKAELDQSYLGMEPPTRFIKPRTAQATRHEYA